MWWYVALWVASMVVSIALAPKPKTTKIKPGEVEAPTAEEGREIPVLFGTRYINGPNVVWYGDIRAQPIRKKGGKK